MQKFHDVNKKKDKKNSSLEKQLSEITKQLNNPEKDSNLEKFKLNYLDNLLKQQIKKNKTLTLILEQDGLL